MPPKSKQETVFFCNECGYESKKWMGQCPACHTWGSFTEEPVKVPAGLAGAKTSAGRALKPVRLDEIDGNEADRFGSGYPEFSRVLGGGIVPGSLILLGGDPGIGKSTLLLQVAAGVSESGKKVLYVSGEESLRQIRLRADRIVKGAAGMMFLCATDIDAIRSTMEKENVDLCIIDSIQTMSCGEISSAPGSVSQLKECAQRLMFSAKSLGTAVFMIGHVTKEGTVAGPRVLEHIVDTVLYFEAADNGLYRILRSAKNRFGSTNEVGVFEMGERGLREVENPSEYLLSERADQAAGSVVTCLMEGTRPLLLEVQGLVCESYYGMARRQSLGIDYNRLNLLLAVLEKRGGINVGRLDAYINIAGGIKVSEPAADLAVLASILSSYRNAVVPGDCLFFGEVGLSGEVRYVPQASERIKEAAKLGFRRVFLPERNIRPELQSFDIELTGIRYISELFAYIKPCRND